jgi:hypothetical protein
VLRMADYNIGFGITPEAVKIKDNGQRFLKK